MNTRWIVVCLGLYLLQPISAAAQEHTIAVSWEATLASRYLFQGTDFSNNNPVVQPALSLGYHGLTLTSWFNFDLDEQHLNETDLLFSYSLELGTLSLTPGYAYYAYPNRVEVDPSQEVYLDLSYTTLLDLSLSTHYDFDAGEGTYFALGLSRDTETAMGTLGLGSTLYFQRNYFEMSGITALELSTNYSTVIRSVTITPSLSYFATWENRDFRDDSAVPSKWLVSVTLGRSY